jgi:hypothetical protein
VRERVLFRPARLASWDLGGFLLAFATLVGMAHLYGFTRIEGQAHWLLHDDFMISQRYAHNLAAGRGLVFNPGERVEGFSDPLTVLAVCLPLEWLRVPAAHLGLFAWCLNGFLHGLIVIVLAGPGDRRARTTGALMALLYATLPHHGFFAHCGLEVYFQALLLLVVVARLPEGGTQFYTALALLPLAHSIDLPLWGLASGVRLLVARDRRRTLGALLLASLPLLGYEVFRLTYFGELLPNTYYLKAGGVFAPWRGLRYLFHGARWLAPSLALCAMGAWRERRRLGSMALLGCLLVPFLVLVVKVGGDNFAWYRFLFILVPALLWTIRETLAEGGGTVLFALVAAQLVVNGIGFSHGHRDNLNLLKWDTSRVVLGYAIRMNTSQDQKVALFGIGNAGYFGERYVLDMLGKTEPHIARTPARPVRQVGHQKDDPAYVMEQRPDFIEMSYDAAALEDRETLESDQHTHWGYFADLALDPEFRRDYRPVPTPPDRPLPLYVRRSLLVTRWAVPVVR